ncbi:uncharacterized protein HD556DRAFT_1227585 [Suillus plorans]|uniref:Mid2 domain-containing protein n=1 Tax=Suillus plorans TaxID=116603 RepID=A0A9P7DTM1_9AGAM|nr:uncharacterized protein HD556DRAFT_1227585 [Suillus plorans]KAG1802689.1 hypothetical protein HD556DRAFT_1227585 [Suillus plorans]
MFSKLAFCSYLALFSLGFANALPSGENGAIVRRQVATSSGLAIPPAVTTTMSIQTANGPMNEVCVLTFTPVGNQIQEVQNCTMSTGANVVSSMVFNSVTSGSVASTSTVSQLASMSATPTVQAAFSMPGRSLQVLPVGLGVFGSITGITIIIVALVTFERVRYRRVFRERRLAEQGAMMGYTGNSNDIKV